MNNHDVSHIRYILKRALQILDYIKDMDEQAFLSDSRTQDAVCMNLLTIGEHVKFLTNEFRSDTSQVPWKKIAGLRDIAAHGYELLRWIDIWQTSKVSIPALIEEIEKILRHIED
jgi:uncharacterized protein with HEPN domain